MVLKFFKNNRHIFTIHLVNKSRNYFNISEPFSSIYNVLGGYSNQLNNIFNRWYNLAKKSFDNGNDIIFCSNSEKFLLLLKKDAYSDYIYLEFELMNNFFRGDPDKNIEGIKDGNFILIAKLDSISLLKVGRGERQEVLTYTISETIPTKDDFAILLSFFITNAFFRFSLECIRIYDFLVRNLITNKRLEKVLELGKNKNYIYDNIIKYQDVIYDIILDSLKQFYSSSDINELVKKSVDFIENNIHKKIGSDIIILYYEKYYLNEGDIVSLGSVPLELEEYLILVDKILNKKSKF